MAWKCLTFSFWLLLRRFCGSSSIEVVGRGREEQKKTQETSAPMGLGGARSGLRRRHPPHFRRPSLNRSSGTDHGLMHLASLSLRASQTTRIFYHCGYRTDGIFRKCLGNIELKSGRGGGGRHSVLQGRPEHQSTCLERRGPRRRGVRGAQGERGILETGSPSGPDLGDRRCA